MSGAGDEGAMEMSGAGSLSAGQREAVATFLAVSNTSSEEEAVRRLRASGWNLDSAVDAFLAESESEATARNARSAALASASAAQSASQASDAEQRMRQLARHEGRARGGGLGAVLRVLMIPLRFAVSVFGYLANRLLAFVGLQPALLAAPDGASPAADFAREFARAHASSPSAMGNAPEFASGSLQDALNQAGREYKFVLVYLHSDTDEHSREFCRDVLLHRPFTQMLRDSFVLWAASMRYAEARAVRRMLRASRFPILAVLRSRSSAARLLNSELVALKQGAVSAREATSWLQGVLSRFGISLTTARIEREEREAARQLREQQDAEFRRALEEDRAKERQKREEDERAREAREREEESRRAAEREAAAAATRREQKRAALPDECEIKDRCATIVLRLPDGGRVSRRFDQELRMSTVFDWADVQGVELQYACLVSNYPRRKLRYPEDADLRLVDAGLAPSAMLLVEERDDIDAADEAGSFSTS